MINKLINKEDINLNDIVNYIFIKQNNFNTYCKKFEKELNLPVFPFCKSDNYYNQNIIKKIEEIIKG